ncbi:hypothetical protein SynA1544_01801 [Synechococcus sp. A15-44]|nr:hypothetical protein SynA1544_01801 [Synechococcus sp. A15-44]
MTSDPQVLQPGEDAHGSAWVRCTVATLGRHPPLASASPSIGQWPTCPPAGSPQLQSLELNLIPDAETSFCFDPIADLHPSACRCAVERLAADQSVGFLLPGVACRHQSTASTFSR